MDPPSCEPIIFRNSRDGGVEINLNRVYIDRTLILSYENDPTFDPATSSSIPPASLRSLRLRDKYNEEIYKDVWLKYWRQNPDKYMRHIRKKRLRLTRDSSLAYPRDIFHIITSYVGSTYMWNDFTEYCQEENIACPSDQSIANISDRSDIIRELYRHNGSITRISFRGTHYIPSSQLLRDLEVIKVCVDTDIEMASTFHFFTKLGAAYPGVLELEIDSADDYSISDRAFDIATRILPFTCLKSLKYNGTGITSKLVCESLRKITVSRLDQASLNNICHAHTIEHMDINKTTGPLCFRAFRGIHTLEFGSLG